MTTMEKMNQTLELIKSHKDLAINWLGDANTFSEWIDSGNTQCIIDIDNAIYSANRAIKELKEIKKLKSLNKG